jgi:cytidylate kinase
VAVVGIYPLLVFLCGREGFYDSYNDGTARAFLSVGSVCSMTAPVISIDGPVGSGKTTVGGVVADRYGFVCLDSGLFYRAAALVVLKKQVNLQDLSGILDAAKSLNLEFVPTSLKPSGIRVFNHGEEVTSALQSSEVESVVSDISRIRELRLQLLEVQREFIGQGGVVAIGRDIGTVVWPDAELKIYLDASLEARTERKCLQRRNSGEIVSVAEARRILESRDRIDSTREYAPLMVAADAVCIDSSNLSPALIADEIDILMRDRDLLVCS